MTTPKNGRGSSRSKSEKKERPKPPTRQKLIPTPEIFDGLVNGYIEMCRESGTPITLSGMVLALGLTSKDSFYNYATYGEGFKESVNRARLYIENAYETRLHGANAAGAMFALKNMGWMDISPEHLEKIRLEVKKLKRDLAEDEDDDQQPAAVYIGVKDARKSER